MLYRGICSTARISRVRFSVEAGRFLSKQGVSTTIKHPPSCYNLWQIVLHCSLIVLVWDFACNSTCVWTPWLLYSTQVYQYLKLLDGVRVQSNSEKISGMLKTVSNSPIPPFFSFYRPQYMRQCWWSRKIGLRMTSCKIQLPSVKTQLNRTGCCIWYGRYHGKYTSYFRLTTMAGIFH